MGGSTSCLSIVARGPCVRAPTRRVPDGWVPLRASQRKTEDTDIIHPIEKQLGVAGGEKRCSGSSNLPMIWVDGWRDGKEGHGHSAAYTDHVILYLRSILSAFHLIALYDLPCGTPTQACDRFTLPGLKTYWGRAIGEASQHQRAGVYLALSMNALGSA